MLKKYIMRYIALALSSHYRTQAHSLLWQIKSVLSPKNKNAEVFLRADDPYSYLLVQVLPELAQRFSIDWKVYIVGDLQPDMYPEPELWHSNSIKDAARLASLYHLKIPIETSLSNHDIATATSLLLMAQSEEESLDNIKSIFDQLWQKQLTAPASMSPQQTELLKNNEQKLLKRGHYLTASIWYAGNWYWGLDRLDHLEQKLNSQHHNLADAEVLFNKSYVNFCRAFEPHQLEQQKSPTPVELFFSIRSPYSHIALERCIKLTKHYDVPLIVKPVIPMVMRGLKVPPTKKYYIFFDTKREANKHGINYGFVSDPLGDGVRRCYALFEYAQSVGKEIDFLVSYSNAVNAQGILSETDKGLKFIVEQAGLDWLKAKEVLATSNWQHTWPDWAEQNELELKQASLWGVPTIKYDNCIVWGQDRVEFIEQAIRKVILK